MPEELIAIPALMDNYIWVLARNSACVVVDPGDAAPILSWMETTGTRPLAVLITHHHGDHVGGAHELAERFRIPVHGPSLERIPEVRHKVHDGDTLALPELGIEFRVMAVPGHTLGHIAYYGHGVLFCGDTLFGCGCGRLFEGTPRQMHDSLARLAALPGDTLVCCAHEYTVDNVAFALNLDPANAALAQRAAQEREKRNRGLPTLPSTIALERATNPFLRCGEPAIRAAAERWSGQSLTTSLEVFSVVREMKNQFRQ